MLSGLFHLVLSCLILLAATLVLRQHIPFTALALPFVLLPFLPFLLGLGWLFAALGVFVRDVAQMMGLAVNVAMFLSPVFYSAKALSAQMQFWMHLNPLTLIIESLRAILLHQQWPDWAGLGLYSLMAMLFCIASGLFFQATRKGFADVL